MLRGFQYYFSLGKKQKLIKIFPKSVAKEGIWSDMTNGLSTITFKPVIKLDFFEALLAKYSLTILKKKWT